MTAVGMLEALDRTFERMARTFGVDKHHVVFVYLLVTAGTVLGLLVAA